MKFELNDYKRQLTDEEILQDISKTAKELSTDYISISTYKKNGKYSQTAIQAHFGTWKNALHLAGLRAERNKDELKLISDEEYFSDLRRVAKLLNSDTVAYSDYEAYGNHPPEYICRRFGKWNTALISAGLAPTGFSKDRITEQQCYDEIERMWRMLGRQPTSTDITKGGICKYSIDPFKKRFGGYRKALESFVEYINAEDSVEKDDPMDEVSTLRVDGQKVSGSEASDEQKFKPHRTSRNINTRMRFLVLQRDNFKCCACGASPAKDPAVVLHVDHIIPWAKGGETTFENLQTLCSKCNLGKSDLLLDENT